MNILPASIYVYHRHSVLVEVRRCKRISLLELALQTVLSCPVVAGNLTHGPQSPVPFYRAVARSQQQ